MSNGTIRGREAFIANLSSRLGRREVAATAPAHPFRGAPEFYKQIKLTTEEKIELFTRNWQALTGKVLVVDEAEAADKVGAWLRDVAAELGVTHVSRWEHEGLKALGLDEALAASGIAVAPWRPVEAGDSEGWPKAAGDANWAQRSELLKRTERCQLGIVWPDFAVANTSTLVLQCSPQRGRSVSLLTEILFAVFRADQLVYRMGEAFEQITRGKQLPSQYASSLNLITGPSRSADIENDLTIGIHGPGKVYAVIIR
ncbi:LutC/YkgG family protein [Paenibacillus ehimensis]|uniref:LUD domain-containing protein n=1 Tax=Paenibacillus ehimensis TaxID=79264 RepID=A0ABT8VEX2_9BACL|nr:LUD domain-containing protein [Paenibacillus ehimensis]MDO3679523.1 LUD domain-containing protein [Paenibacillus ehimensis]MEC0208564.1 LUD domain-containing protein [Paenibacillus ehimensis]